MMYRFRPPKDRVDLVMNSGSNPLNKPFTRWNDHPSIRIAFKKQWKNSTPEPENELKTSGFRHRRCMFVGAFFWGVWFSSFLFWWSSNESSELSGFFCQTIKPLGVPAVSPSTWISSWQKGQSALSYNGLMTRQQAHNRHGLPNDVSEDLGFKIFAV